MEYNGVVYRPPVEAGTFLAPVTEGCTHNTCAFCNMYRGVRFRMLPLQVIEEHLQETRRSYGVVCERIERVYLVGADPFALPAARLLERIELMRRYLPNASTFTMYARTDNVSRKSDEELTALRKAGVDDLYMGVECGLDDVLGRLNKGYSAQETHEQCLRLNRAGIHHCDLLMLGTAGAGRGLECARTAAALENEIRPSKILVNTLSAFAGTPLDDDILTGAFTPATERKNLQEERALVEALDLPERFFWAVHPLDSAKVEGVLGRDKQRMLGALDWAIGHVDEDAIKRTSRVGTL